VADVVVVLFVVLAGEPLLRLSFSSVADPDPDPGDDAIGSSTFSLGCSISDVSALLSAACFLKARKPYMSLDRRLWSLLVIVLLAEELSRDEDKAEVVLFVVTVVLTALTTSFFFSLFSSTLSGDDSVAVTSICS